VHPLNSLQRLILSTASATLAFKAKASGAVHFHAPWAGENVADAKPSAV